jgi:hypothetical protein
LPFTFLFHLVLVIANILVALAQGNKLQDALHVIAQLSDAGIELTIELYNILIEILAKIHPMNALKLLNMIKKKKNIKPSIVTYTTIISIFRKLPVIGEDEKEAVLQLANDILLEISNSNLEMDVQSYYVLIKFYVQYDRDYEVEFLFENMRSNNILPNRRVYYVMLYFYGKNEGVPHFAHKFFALIHEIRSKGYVINRAIYLGMIRRFLHMGNENAALRTLSELKKMNSNEGDINYLSKACISFCLFYLNRSDYQKAREFERLSIESGYTPNWAPGIHHTFILLEKEFNEARKANIE